MEKARKAKANESERRRMQDEGRKAKRREELRQWREKNPVAGKAYREANKEKYREYNRRPKVAEKKRGQRRAYRAKLAATPEGRAKLQARRRRNYEGEKATKPARLCECGAVLLLRQRSKCDECKALSLLKPPPLPPPCKRCKVGQPIDGAKYCEVCHGDIVKERIARRNEKSPRKIRGCGN